MNHPASDSSRALHIAASGLQMAARATHVPLRRLSWAVSALFASAALVACGGGGGDSAAESSASATAATMDTDTATNVAATAAQNSTDVPALVDASVATVESLNAAAPAVAGAAGEARSTAQSVPGESAALLADAPTSVSVPLPCAVAGQATLTISGAPLAQLLNGRLDTGEQYELSFDACQTAAGQPVFNGKLSLSVVADTSTGHTLRWTASGLSGSVPLGLLTLDGTVTRELALSTDSSGATLRHSHVTATGLALQGTYNGHVRASTLDTLDLTRDSRWVNGVPVSAQVSGQCQVTQQRSVGSYSFALGLQGQVMLGSDGLAITGEWLLTLPGSSVDLLLDGTQAVISIDQGKNGSVDHKLTLPLGRLQASAG